VWCLLVTVITAAQHNNSVLHTISIRLMYACRSVKMRRSFIICLLVAGLAGVLGIGCVCVCGGGEGEGIPLKGEEKPA
jgi:hypothetical protein